MAVSTTRPETMLGDVAVAVHPDDPRYQVRDSRRRGSGTGANEGVVSSRLFMGSAADTRSATDCCPSSPTPWWTCSWGPVSRTLASAPDAVLRGRPGLSPPPPPPPPPGGGGGWYHSSSRFTVLRLGHQVATVRLASACDLMSPCCTSVNRGAASCVCSTCGPPACVCLLRRCGEGHARPRPHRLPAVTETRAAAPDRDWRRRDHDGGLWALAAGLSSPLACSLWSCDPLTGVPVVS